MAEALAGLSVACNIIDLVKHGQEAAAICRQVYKDGQDVRTSTLKETTEALRDAITEWRTPPSTVRARGLATTSQACLRTVGELKNELDSISVTGKKTLSKVLGTSLKSMKKAGHIQKLKGQLKDYEDVMNTQILLQLSKQVSELDQKQDKILSDNVKQLQNLLQQLRNNNQWFIDSIRVLRNEIAQNIQNEHAQTRDHTKQVVKAGIKDLEKSNENQHVHTRDHTEKVVTNRLRDFRVSQDVAARQQQVLKSLVVPEMLQRQESSKLSPHKDTCEWIFKPGAAKEKGWDDFVEWLEHGGSTYWISGKPGSGKSTLMNFLIHEGKERIVSHFQPQSNPSACYVLSAFIFEAGTELQRNALGLLRTILWQLLKEDLDRGGSFFSLVESVSPGMVDSVWTERQLLSCLKGAFSGTQATFCLIVDGLDEFEDELWLLQLLESFEQIPNVKMCVSSRPEVVLTKTLEHNPKLRLQDLTQTDIENFIDERLIKPLSLNPRFSKSLKSSMIYRAEGVFLWVDLVVKDLHSGHLKGASPEDLQRRLDDLPPGLFNLYTRMLERNNREMEIYKSEAQQYLRLIYAAGPLTLLQVKIALERSLQDSFLLPDSTWNYAEICALDCKQLATQIRARCAGLLELRPTPSHSSNGDFVLGFLFASNCSPNSQLEMQPAARDIAAKLSAFSSLTVQFVHRSVMDYLKSSDQGKSIIGSQSEILQDELENANRARLVSAIASCDVEGLVNFHPRVPDIFWDWLYELSDDYSTLSLAFLAFNRITLEQRYGFESPWASDASSNRFRWFTIPGESQHGINFLFWLDLFVDYRQALNNFIRLRAQKLDSCSEICHQLLSYLPSLYKEDVQSPPLQDLSVLLLTSCHDLDRPHFALFTPKRTISIRERFMKMYRLRESYLGEDVRAILESEKGSDPANLGPIEPTFIDVCRRDYGSRLYFRCVLDHRNSSIRNFHDLFTCKDFELCLLWDAEEMSWYDVSNTDALSLTSLCDKILPFTFRDVFAFTVMGSIDVLHWQDEEQELLSVCQHLKASGRKVECAQQIAQILQWPPLMPDELVDLEEILLSREEVPDSDILQLQERMALRLQGLRPDPLVPVPEFTEWFVETYAPERYKPASCKK